MTGRHQSCERVGQLVPIERLYEKTIHARIEAGITIVNQPVGRQRKDRGAAEALAGFLFTNSLCGLDAVKLRHLDVHQDEIVGRTRGFGGDP